ncbi:SpoVR family protein [Paenibacillus polymyxa]|uniref:SpoVR family protein n=1 Tax=Paenibacillus polymyxa TaxID=1406 RepID=UPI00307D5F1C
MSTDQKELEYAISEIMEIADGFGLDYYPMRYEICPADIVYTFGAYGMPTRFSHWSFGKTNNHKDEKKGTQLKGAFSFLAHCS